MLSAPNKPRSDFIARREHILGSCRENGDARELPLSLVLGRALPIMIHWLRVRAHTSSDPARFPGRPRERRPPVFITYSPRLGQSRFPPRKRFNVQASFRRPESGANRSRRGSPGRYSDPGSWCRATARHGISSRPGLANGGAVPARSGRSARWLAVPSRCPTRDGPPRRGP